MSADADRQQVQGHVGPSPPAQPALRRDKLYDILNGVIQEQLKDVKSMPAWTGCVPYNSSAVLLDRSTA